MKVFGYDSSLMRALNSLADTVVMGVAWLVSSLPVITIGASTAALCQVTINGFHGEKKSLSAFFRAFKENFSQATLVWLMLAAGFAIFGGALYGVRQIPADILRMVLTVACLTLLYVTLVMGIYVFPFKAYYKRIGGSLPFLSLIRTAMAVGAANPFRAFPIVIVMAIPVVLFFFLPLVFVYLTPFWIVLWPAMLIQWITGRLNRQFQDYDFEEAEG